MNKDSRTYRVLLRSLALGVLAFGLVAVAGCGGDDDDDDAGDGGATPVAKVGGLEIFDAWARTTTNDVSAAYFTVKNSGGADTLVKASADVSMMVQLHEVITEGASSKMQEKPGGFPVPANGELGLKPGGYHVMMMNLKEPLAEGDSVELTLEFEKAGKVTFSAPVRPGPTQNTPDMHGGMGMSTNTSTMK